MGDAAEATVIAKLNERGYVVSIPFGHAQDYDLIWDRDGSLLRVQVKLGQLNGKGSVHAKTTKHGTPYENVDVWAIVNGGNVYMVPNTGQTAVTIRLPDDTQRPHPAAIPAEEVQL
jgi:hypothetical protein